jgi:hypothetical protein
VTCTPFQSFDPPKKLCRERAVARLERKVERLVDQKRADQAARLRFAAHYLRQAALRDRLHAAALRRLQ